MKPVILTSERYPPMQLLHATPKLPSTKKTHIGHETALGERQSRRPLDTGTRRPDVNKSTIPRTVPTMESDGFVMLLRPIVNCEDLRDKLSENDCCDATISGFRHVIYVEPKFYPVSQQAIPREFAKPHKASLRYR
jgi:hypothetical protein